ncbi:MAG TPA: phenylalanine--tRNA ligase subunit beta [Actinomycetes bacterium]|nr:phenylalanine--tRNA ligase subunit beta [Actinomycetes bacterium]
MRVPLSWLRELVAVPGDLTGRDVAERLIRAGLEVETVDEIGVELAGPLVIGRVLAVAEEEHSNGKTIRWCRVDVGPEHNQPGAGPDAEASVEEQAPGRGIVCGARNFSVGDLVVVALPGATLPGGFAIEARKTYGHVSDGMICSTRELGTGDDHDGIWVLPDNAGTPGADAVSVLGLRDDVLDIAVTPDRGYCMSMRGIARESAIAFGLPFVDPASMPLPDATSDDWPVKVDDTVGCDRFVTRSVQSLDPRQVSPLWMQRKLQLSGMRPISLAVDITNFVMLELGQPLHAYDRSALAGSIVVRRAHVDESLKTLDGSKRSLDPQDLLITDDSGAIGVAGVMGGASTEINPATTDIVIEAAHFDPDSVSRSSRRHKLHSEASRRFARGVDVSLQEVAAERAASLLVELGGATLLPGRTVVDYAVEPTAILLDVELPSRLVGLDYTRDEVVSALQSCGCEVAGDDDAGDNTGDRTSGAATLVVTPPSWRPDLLIPADLVEEVARIHGYDAIPSLLPEAPAGGGLTDSQRLHRRVGMVLAGAGLVEVQSYPFLSPQVHDKLGLPDDDARRRALRIANPLSDEEPELRTSLLPGLLATLRRNIGRGFDDAALFETGLVFRPDTDSSRHPNQTERPGVERRPTDAELAELDALLPRQPRRVAVVLTGQREPSGWWGAGRAATWGDAVEAALLVAGAAGVDLEISSDEHAPWHPGRCAALRLDGELVGHAGELHPRVLADLGLPARTCAMELELDVIDKHASKSPTPAPHVSTYPVAKEDVSLLVADAVTAFEVAEALRVGGGDLIESVRLFDVFASEQLGAGNKSLAFSLRFRAPDRTLAPEEVAAARDAAVAEAHHRTGAVQRA